jgi:hypothetical protein
LMISSWAEEGAGRSSRTGGFTMRPR